MAKTLPAPLPRILRTEEIIPTTARLLDEDRELIDDLKKTIEVSAARFENVAYRMAKSDDRQIALHHNIPLLKYCSPVAETQRASEKATEMRGTYFSEYYQRVDLYNLLEAAKQWSKDLDYEDQRLLDKMLADFVRYGPSMQNCSDYEERIWRLSDEFARNLREDNSGDWFTSEELDGTQGHARKSGEMRADGKEFICTDGNSYPIVMKYAINPKTRERLYRARSQGLAGNIPIFREIILLRDEIARQRGFKSYADSQLRWQLAGSTQYVDDLLKELWKTVQPFAQAEIQSLRTKKQSLEQEELQPWDVSYYRHMIETEAQVDQVAIAQYFPLRHLMRELLAFFGDCLTLRFDPIPSEQIGEATWHPDVEGFAVWDGRLSSRGDFVGYLYIDLEGRPHKQKGGFSTPLQLGHLEQDGSRIYPTTVLVASFSNSSPTTGCLIPHGGVVTLFHELGHCIHGLLTRTKYTRFSAFSAEPELAEGLGKLFGEFAWVKDILKSLSCHYTHTDSKYAEAWLTEHPGHPLPPKTIPDALIDGLLDRRPHSNLVRLVNILHVALYDMAVHNPPSREALLQMNEAQLFGDLFQEVKLYRPPEPNNLHVSIGHIVSPYGAGCYSYACAEVIGRDIYETKFASNPRDRVAWEELRRQILEYGASRDGLEMLQEYLGGRLPDPKALLSILQPVEVNVKE